MRLHFACDHDRRVVVQYLNRRKLSSGITLDEFVVMWFQIACGLRYLHGHKPLPIIHRDIKPDNIMVRFQMHARNRLLVHSSACAGCAID